MDNKRLLIAAALSMAVLFGWQLVFPPPPAPERPPVAAPSPAPIAVGTNATTGAPEANPPDMAPAATAAVAEPAAPAPPLGADAEERVRLENDLVAAEFSNRGGVLTSLGVRPNGKSSERLELVASRGKGTYPFALVGRDGRALPLGDALFAAERGREEAGERVTFRYRGPSGEAEKSFLLRPDGRIDFTFVTPKDVTFAAVLGPGLRLRSAADLADRFTLRKAAWSVGGKVETLAPAKARDPLELAGVGLDWAALEDTYFLTAFVPAEPFAAVRYRPVLLEPAGAPESWDWRPIAPSTEELSATDKKLPRELLLEVEGSGGRLAGTSYWGPKQFDRLSALPYGLERTVELGMFGILARPLLKGLQWIHANWVANYGWAIVIMTTLLKILLLPLSISAFKSMRKMQAINPKMQAIRERWKGKLRGKDGKFNPEAQRQMNEEIMGLYRAEGVNPAGGCLPLVIQLPIFFAYYSLLSTAVELWRSPWIGWIHDLTIADPYYVLPIVMGISQVVQQRMTPPPPDPVQKRLMQFLPIVFTVFSLGFASGLVLYWLTNNVLSIVQQSIYNRIQDRTHPLAAAVATAPRKGKKAR